MHWAMMFVSSSFSPDCRSMPVSIRTLRDAYRRTQRVPWTREGHDASSSLPGASGRGGVELVSYPCVYDTRQRRITAVDGTGRQHYRQVQILQLML
jgi:hypothetical protein